MAGLKVPHLEVPFRVERGRALTVEQDTSTEIAQNVKVLVLTHRGERLVVPDFGIVDPTFELGDVTAGIAAAIRRFEPRARAEVERQLPDEEGEVPYVVRVRGSREG